MNSVTTIKVHLPFLLRWVKRYIRLEIQKHPMQNEIRGFQADTIICDDISQEVRR